MFKVIFTYLKAYLKWRDADFIALYQVGKIGGGSIYRALQEAGKKVEHRHNFRAYSSGASDLQECLETLRADSMGTIRNRYKGKLNKNLSRLGLQARKKPLKVIVGIREPIALNISRFFQDISAFTLDYLNGYTTGKRQWEALNQGDVFLENAFNSVVKHDYPVTWFDREFKSVTGVDIYQFDFDKSLGYTVIQKGKYEIFLYRFENLFNDDVLKALTDFTGVDINLSNINSGAVRWYRDVYTSFKKSYRPSKALLDSLYETQCMRYFYTDQEIEGFYMKYLGADIEENAQ